MLDVLQRLRGLLARGIPCQLTGGRINTQLTGHEHETIGLHRLAVRAQRGRGLRSSYGFHLLAHYVLLLLD